MYHVMYNIFKFGPSVTSVLKFVSESRLEMRYISLIVNTKSSLFDLHDFHLLVLIP